MRKLIYLLIFVASVHNLVAQEVPTVYSNLGIDETGVYMILGDRKIYAHFPKDEFLFRDLYGNPMGTAKGIVFDFKFPTLNGTLYYGFINYKDGSYPLPVYFRSPSPIVNGTSFINIADLLSGRYDMIGWEKSGKGILGYRIVNDKGTILYDGKVAFSYRSNRFVTEPTVIEGPFVNQLTPDGATISFVTTKPVEASIKVAGKTIRDRKVSMVHEMEIKGLQPKTRYDYTLMVGQFDFTFALETAPEPGSREKFTFAYASDCREGQGGGERNIFGTNAYIMKKMAALARAEGAKFMQFTGDLINGYDLSRERMHLQYANWKHAVEPFWHHYPIVPTMGNHEAYVYYFEDTASGNIYMIDHFPYDGESAESLFQEHFVLPENGPYSEDGSRYDPDPVQVDFPSYKESVFWYSYGNVAMIVLNSDYWYSPAGLTSLGGNPHGFLMDNQVKWLERKLKQLEKDRNIDHIFITIHTPFFPNGGHVGDDMWYRGNNSHRPWVNGEPYEQGIIQRRDELLDLIINRSTKTVAILSGDEHNYNLLTVTDEMERYPKDYPYEKLKLNRKFYQINNGAAGAPYYAQEETPWMDHLRNFSTQNALVLIDVDGPRVHVRVKNPDTLELIDEYTLRE